jgi:hypothetical protein
MYRTPLGNEYIVSSTFNDIAISKILINLILRNVFKLR